MNRLVDFSVKQIKISVAKHLLENINVAYTAIIGEDAVNFLRGWNDVKL